MEPEIMSNGSFNSQFNSDFKKHKNMSSSGLWYCKQLRPIRPAVNTTVSGLFEAGMGVEDPKNLRPSVSMTRLDLDVSRRFNKQRDRSYQDGVMRGIIQPEEHDHQQGGFVTERVPKKMIDTDTLPRHRLNSAQK